MNELNLLQKRTDRFQRSILSSVEHFRNTEDYIGLDMLLNSIEDLENILDSYQYADESNMKIDELLPAVQTLYAYMKNQDIVGMTDILEFTIYPLTKHWLKEDNNK